MRGKDRVICEMREIGLKHELKKSRGFARERGDRSGRRISRSQRTAGTAVCRFPFPNRMRFSASESEIPIKPLFISRWTRCQPLEARGSSAGSHLEWRRKSSGTAMRIVAEGVEALAAACAGGHLEKVEELVAAGAPPANIDTFSTLPHQATYFFLAPRGSRRAA